MPTLNSETDFWSNVKIMPGDCWIWEGGINQGYGMWGMAGRQTYAHRWSYEFEIDDIPERHHIHHLCAQRLCVNPVHLECISIEDHARIHGRKETCKRGHDYSDSYIRKDGNRQCRECGRETARVRRVRGSR